MRRLLPSLRRRSIAQRALRGPVLLLLLASLLLCTGSSAVPSPLQWAYGLVTSRCLAVADPEPCSSPNPNPSTSPSSSLRA